MTNKMKLYSVEYYGHAVMDKRFSKPMLPWIIAEIKRRKTLLQICLGVQDGMVHAYNLDVNAGQEPLYRHSLSLVTRFSHAYESHCTFMYLLRDPNETLACHLYQAEQASDVVELFTSMKEQTWKETSMAAPLNSRTSSNAAQLTSLCADISPSSSHFFEVLYIGKIKVSHKKVPESFIDDALEKFKLHEAEKERSKPDPVETEGSGQEERSNAPPTSVVISMCADEDSKVKVENVMPPTTVLSPTVELGHKLGGSSEDLQENEPPTPAVNKAAMRTRAASTGSVRDVKRPDPAALPDHNRTMLFLVGRTDLRLISPDRKQILLHKNLRDVAKCIQGVRHGEHFGFICREANLDCFIGYVFKCQSESFADDVVGAITQAFLATAEQQARRKEKLPVFSCEHCPMVWYHKLCTEVEGLNDKRTQATIFRRLELLPDEEQAAIVAKLQGAELSTLREHNEFLMMLLRAHCEAKQSRHAHDTAENRSEFLNQYLGNSTIFMKAKRSLTSSFDQLLKRKGSRDDFGPILKELSLPANSTLNKESQNSSSSSLADADSTSTQSESAAQRMRKRSSTLGAMDGETMKRELHRQYPNHPASRSDSGSSGSVNAQLSVNTQGKATPMMNIFMKVGNQPKTSPPLETTPESLKQSGSWRQAIYNRVVTPNKNIDGTKEDRKLDKAELRSLWKKAINQQLILIRMEKENARLTARQEEATVKRIKLEYDEISACQRQVGEVWDLLISRESKVNSKCDSQMLVQAVKQGIPRSKRGEVWRFLADQHCLNLGPVDPVLFPLYQTAYPALLHQLTSHQHAILIDLGRTFPGHAYFASPLGPGQLALFNLLKAYSLLDPEVGYCQGLSFVAGVLLLHVSESEAFFLLRHLMCRRKLRMRYCNDMAALQLSLYQLSRLIHDRLGDVDRHFDRHDVAPTLYAAPWLLTLFASQFPLGFVTRVFDLLFLDGPDVVFRVAVALLSEHQDGLLKCQSFEEIMDYLKTTLPDIDKPVLDRVMKEVFAMDVSKQLREYEVEYQVLQEEMSSPRLDPEDLERLEREKQQLLSQNQALVQQLQIATSNVHRLEQSRTMQQTSINRLETQVRSMEVSVAAMGNFLTLLTESNADIELPGEIRRIITQLDVAFQRRASSNKPRNTGTGQGVPLRVINDEDKPADTRRVLKTALSSPNLSLKLAGMSGFFHPKTFLSPNDPALDTRKISAIMDEGKIIKSNSDGSKVVILPELRENFEKEQSEPPPCKPPLRTSRSSFELGGILRSGESSGDSGNVTPTSPAAHPLDSCSGVSFTYGGTTKLKTIRPLRANLSRNASSDNIFANGRVVEVSEEDSDVNKGLGYIRPETNSIPETKLNYEAEKSPERLISKDAELLRIDETKSLTQNGESKSLTAR